MAAMNMVPAGWFLGVSFHLRRCPQWVSSLLCKKTPIFGSRRSKLDDLTVIQRLQNLKAVDPFSFQIFSTSSEKYHIVVQELGSVHDLEISGYLAD
jgi:hypothetical protein